MHFIIVTLMLEYTLFIYIASVYMLHVTLSYYAYGIYYNLHGCKNDIFSGKCAMFSYVSLIYSRDCGVLDTWAL